MTPSAGERRRKPDPVNEEALDEIRHALSRVEHMNATANAIQRFKPAPGSVAADDGALPESHFAVLGAERSISVSVDHLRSWRQILDSGVMTTWAPWTLLRGAMEGASLASWLVDPAVDGLTRVARGVALQLEDYQERSRFESAPELGPPSGGKAAVERMADLRAAREAGGIPVVTVDGSTALARRYGPPGRTDRSWLFRLASAFAHGKEWAGLAMNIREHESADPRFGRAYLSANETILAGATTLTVSQVATAITGVQRYIGMPDDG